MLQGDIKNNISKIVEKSIEKKVEFIMATPPCQSFSNAGKKKN
jgi:site-specific DNA-cytosine methylase